MDAATMVRLECSGCGAALPLDMPYPFRCPRARAGDGIDHLVVRRLDVSRLSFPAASHPNPFIAWRDLFYTRWLAAARGISDERLCARILELDDAVAAVDGHGFTITPLLSVPGLAETLGIDGELWVKDETGNVSGSHKARHLMGIMLYLQLARDAGLIDADRRRLAIASCGNAALAAAVVARAADWPLDVFIPPSASPTVVARLEALGARLTVCHRDNRPGDPCYHAFQAALEQGALPFCCQGPDNGLTIEGGETLGYELVHPLAGSGGLDRLMIQVGGGALASATLQALLEAFTLGALPALPRICAVQTHGAYPLRRAYERILERLATRAPGLPLSAPSQPRADWIRTHVSHEAIQLELRYAATHRAAFMWPWEEEPVSIAHGILDDETYDWRAILEGMLLTGGYPVTVDEETLEAANAAALEATGIPVDHTGTSGLAGLLQLRADGALEPGERVAVLFTGRRR